MLSKKSRRGPGKLEGALEVRTLVALVPEAVEALPNDRDHEEVPGEDVVEAEAHDRVLLFFSTDIDL